MVGAVCRDDGDVDIKIVRDGVELEDGIVLRTDANKVVFSIGVNMSFGVIAAFEADKNPTAVPPALTTLVAMSSTAVVPPLAILVAMSLILAFGVIVSVGRLMDTSQ